MVDWSYILVVHMDLLLFFLVIHVNDPVIKASFFGEGYKDKIPKEQWTEQYLDLLGCAAIAECFNAEYLYYLNEVAEHVHKKKLEKKIVKWILRFVIPAAGAVGLAGFIWLLAKLI